MKMLDDLLFSCKNEKLKFEVSSLINQKVYTFNNCEMLPEEKGVYFIKDKENNIIYIGCAYKSDRTIKIRCRQYIQKGSGGASLRKKVNRFFTKGKRNKHYNNEILWLKNNCFIQCLTFKQGSKTEADLLLLERICISIFNPILND